MKIFEQLGVPTASQAVADNLPIPPRQFAVHLDEAELLNLVAALSEGIDGFAKLAADPTHHEDDRGFAAQMVILLKPLAEQLGEVANTI